MLLMSISPMLFIPRLTALLKDEPSSFGFLLIFDTTCARGVI